MHIKKGDNVKVLAGKDKGKKGKVVRAFPKTNQVIVTGLNLKKVTKRAKKEGEKGKLVSVEFPIHSSNVALDE